MSHNPTAEHPPPGWPPPYPPGQHPRPGRRRPGWVVPAIALVVVLLAGVITVVLPTGDQPRGGPADSGPPAATSSADGSPGGGVAAPEIPVEVPGWGEGQPITGEILRSVKPEDLFWTVYKRQAMIPIQELVLEDWVAPAGKPLASEHLVTPHIRTIRTIFNYQTKEFAKSTTARNTRGQVATLAICVDGQQFMRTETALETGRPYSQVADGAKDCPLILDKAAYQRKSTIATWLNDAFMTGGLTGEQADRFVDCLREWQLVSVAKVAMVEAAGKQYVAVEGEVNRVEATELSTETKQGTNLLRQCFDDATGLDQRFHPYPFTVGGLQGLRWVYYLDPTTLRPAVSKVETTPVLGLDGSVSPVNVEYNESVSWCQWGYPAAVPKFTLADGEQHLSVAWPPGLPGK